jgi:dTDP-4-dehydrorhamnose 3,5-epimerase
MQAFADSPVRTLADLASPPALPQGVMLRPLATNRDARGSLTEIFRSEWKCGVEPCQWNLSVSEANVLRGAHLHIRHRDYFIVARGRAVVGLYDLRPSSPTHRAAATFELCGERLQALVIPAGVIHAFYSIVAAVYLYGVDGYYSPDDELGCRWTDPDLHLDLPTSDPLLSERDRTAGSLAALEAQLRRLQVKL